MRKQDSGSSPSALRVEVDTQTYTLEAVNLMGKAMACPEYTLNHIRDPTIT